jgi:protein ImuA
MLLPIPGQRGPQTRPLLPLPGLPGQGLARGRVHEFCGPAAVTLAAALMGQDQGPVVWIAPAWTNGRIHPPGLAAFADPGRVIFALCRRADEMLWAMEESLRSGTVPLVIADLLDPPGLTPVRRLHLAAEAGAERAHNLRQPPPLGVLLTPGDGGAAGIESRWHFAPRPSDPAQAARGRRLWQLERRRARTAPPAAWTLSREPSGGFASQPAPLASDRLAPDQGPFTAT